MTWDTFTLVLADGTTEATASQKPGTPDNTSGAPVALEGQDASGSTPIDNSKGGDNKQGPGGLLWMLLPLALVFLMLSMGNRKEKKKKARMMSALSKGDKVQTVGGVLGTVVEVRDEEVIVKVDENANTRLRFTRSAIQSILEPKNAG